MKRIVAPRNIIFLLLLLGFIAVSANYSIHFSRRDFATFNNGIPGTPVFSASAIRQQFILPPGPGGQNRLTFWLRNPHGKKVHCRFHLFESVTGKIYYKKTFILLDHPSGWHTEHVIFPSPGLDGGGSYTIEIQAEKEMLGFTPLEAPGLKGALSAGDSVWNGFLPFELHTVGRTSWLKGVLQGTGGNTGGGGRIVMGGASALFFALAGLFLIQLFASEIRFCKSSASEAAIQSSSRRLSFRHYSFLIYAALFLWSIIASSFFLETNTYAQLMGAEDDAFITYRYARNIAEGEGFRFNGDEKTLGTTTPLYTLIMAGTALLFKNVPLTSLLLNWLSLFLGGIIVARFLSEFMSPASAALGGAVFFFFPIFHRVSGMETNFLIFLILASIGLFNGGKHGWAFVVAGLATLTRSEAVLLAPVFMLILAFRREYKKAFFGAAGFLFTVLPWFIFSLLYFDVLLPNTFYIKTSGGHLGGTVADRILEKLKGLLSLRFLDSAFLKAFARELRDYFHYYLTWVALTGAGLLLSIREIYQRLPIRLLLFWVCLYILGFAVLDTPPFAWYYALAFAPAPLFVVIGVHRVGAGITRLFRQKQTGAIVAALLGVLLLGFEINGILELYHGEWYARHLPRLERYEAYLRMAASIRAGVPVRASVAMEEIGVIGYYTPNKIWDFYSLVHRAGQLPFGFPAESKQRIPYLLTLMNADYVVVSSHRFLTHYAFRDYETAEVFPVRQYRWDPEFYYMLLKKKKGRTPMLGELNLNGPLRGRVILTGWVFGAEKLHSVRPILNDAPLKDSIPLENSPAELRDLFIYNPHASQALFHWSFDTTQFSDGRLRLKLEAEGDTTSGAFWEGEIEIRNGNPVVADPFTAPRSL